MPDIDKPATPSWDDCRSIHALCFRLNSLGLEQLSNYKIVILSLRTLRYSWNTATYCIIGQLYNVNFYLFVISYNNGLCRFLQVVGSIFTYTWVSCHCLQVGALSLCHCLQVGILSHRYCYIIYQYFVTRLLSRIVYYYATSVPTYLYTNMGSRCNRLRCPLARMSGMRCFNMGHNGHGINLYGVSMTLMGN